MDDLFRRVQTDTPVAIIGGNGHGGRFSDLATFVATGGIDRACRTD
jgi:hypothetical protein